MKILIALLGAALLYWLFILRPGRLDFWRLVGKHPDLAYDFFKSRDCWQVFEDGLPADHGRLFPPAEWVGPFRLCVPKLANKMVHIFGRASDYEDSQNELINRIRSN